MPNVGAELASSILNAEQKDEADISEQRDRANQLKQKLQTIARANGGSPLLEHSPIKIG